MDVKELRQIAIDMGKPRIIRMIRRETKKLRAKGPRMEPIVGLVDEILAIATNPESEAGTP